MSSTSSRLREIARCNMKRVGIDHPNRRLGRTAGHENGMAVKVWQKFCTPKSTRWAMSVESKQRRKAK